MKDERKPLLPEVVAKMIDSHAGMIWRSAEQAWQDVSADFPDGIRAHCMQVVYLEAEADDGNGVIMGCALSTPPNLSPKNVVFVLDAVVEQMERFQLESLKRKAAQDAGVSDADP